jgi:hypothetical protein
MLDLRKEGAQHAPSLFLWFGNLNDFEVVRLCTLFVIDIFFLTGWSRIKWSKQWCKIVEMVEF